MAAAWEGSGLQPRTEALKHFFLCFSQPKWTPAPVSARLTVTHADLSVCACVSVREKKAWAHSLYLLFSLLPGCSRHLSLCVRGGKRCVRLYLESLQTPSSPLLSPPSVLSARRICQFSFSLFVPALILLSKPWLASLTAAEHRSYSTPTNSTHSCHAGMMRVHRHTQTLAAPLTPPLLSHTLQNR